MSCNFVKKKNLELFSQNLQVYKVQLNSISQEVIMLQYFSLLIFKDFEKTDRAY